MQIDDNLKQLFSNYKNLSEANLQKLIVSVIKKEKEKLGIKHPIIFTQDFERQSGGDCSIEYNEELKRDEIHISLNYQNLIYRYLNNRNSVNLNRDQSLETLYDIVEVVCHEMRHAYQLSKMLNKDITHDKALTWLKERIVLSQLDDHTYSINHSNWSQENDSYNYQYEAALNYIKQYCDLSQILQQQYDSLINLSDSKRKKNMRDSENLIIDVNGQSIKLEDFLNEQMETIIQTLPEQSITSTILSYEYNADKTKKSYHQLMEDKQKRIESIDHNSQNYHQQVQRIEHIYTTIVKNDRNLQQQSTVQNLPQTYVESKRKYGEYSSAIEELMKNKNNYSEIEYQQRLNRLMLNRDAVQKQMDRNLQAVASQKSDFVVNHKISTSTLTTPSEDLASKVERVHISKQTPLTSVEETKEELVAKKQEILRQGWKERLDAMKRQGKVDIPNLESIFQQQQLNELHRINVEQNEQALENGRKIM